MKSEKKLNEKLKKIIVMANKGTPNERKNAINIIKKICKKYDLVFEEVMDYEVDLEKFEFCYRDIASLKLATQVFARYVGDMKCRYNRHYKTFYFKTTKSKFIEFENALYEYAKVYKKEQKKMNQKHKEEKQLFAKAFIQKHGLYRQETDEEFEERTKKMEKLTEKELRDIEMTMKMASDMDEDVTVNKLIEN